MIKDLTKGPPLKSIILFSLPLIAGNFCQQLYNIIDTVVVGRFLGSTALAAVGTAFALMVFLTSMILGLCLGSGILFSQFFGAQDQCSLQESIRLSFMAVGLATILITVLTYLLTEPLITLLQVPPEVRDYLRTYLLIIFAGTPFVFLYNWSAALLRSLGNSKVPFYFLIMATFINIVLDLVFILLLELGVGGAALATIIAQALSGIFCFIYYLKSLPDLRLDYRHFKINRALLIKLGSYSLLTSLQQSIMNFGILMIQGLVNSFGEPAMAAFAAVVKIDAFAYLPVQDFGNAFSTYIAQNLGANKIERIHQGSRQAAFLVSAFGITLSALVLFFAQPLMTIFISPQESEIITLGCQYLHIEGLFYALIALLFLCYGFYRGLGRVSMSIVLTILSLGTRVILAYNLAPIFGLPAIWWAIPTGWLLADLLGFSYYFYLKRKGNLNNEYRY